MRRPMPRLAAVALLTALSACSSPAAGPGSDAATPSPPRRIARAVLEDRIRGGWAGKMIGVAYGAPTEFKAMGAIYEAPLKWSPEKVSNAIGQDDLYVGMTLAETMDRLGLDAPCEQYGEAFKESQYGLWHANAGARRLLNQGVKAPMSGHPKYNIHANDIDFQIECDFIGLMCPGLPRASNLYSDRVGRVMAYGDGLYGGMFLNGMYAAAFFESDMRKVVEQGLACLPADSSYARLIRDVLVWSQELPGDWRLTWRRVQETWDRDDPCPDGALKPFNIDARINGAYIAIGLLYGGTDLGKVLEISTRCGQDSDCNPSSAAGVLGVMTGWAAIPDAWKSGIPAIADRKFQYTQSSFNDICRSTLDRALRIVEQAGGRVDGDTVVIPVQAALPAPLEQWDMGTPAKRVAVSDASWSWKGDWTEASRRRSAGAAGAEATFSFTGASVAIVGPCSQKGGRADVWLDGKKMDSGINAWIPERTNDNALWHAYGLAQGPHTVRIVVRGDADPRSKGASVAIEEAIVYRAR
jgi:hypothetical protein